jgi:hypothetical protein
LFLAGYQKYKNDAEVQTIFPLAVLQNLSVKAKALPSLSQIRIKNKDLLLFAELN